MTHFLDEVPFNLSDPAAKSLVDFLATTYSRENDIVRFVLATGIDAAGIAWGRSAREEWLDAFLRGALEGKNRNFVELIAGSGDKAVEMRLAEFLAAMPVAPPAAVPQPDWNAIPMTAELERQTAAEPTLLDVTFLERGTQLARGVVRLLVTMPNGKRYYGTGFLIAPDLLLTNHHVLFDEDRGDVRATDVEVWFGYERDFGGVLRPHVAIEAAPDSIQSNKENDWAVIRVTAADVPQTAVVIDIGQLGSVGVDDRVYIVQHPNGGPKQIGMIHNVVRFVDEAVVQYLTDTEPGSSGSPVFDEEWRLVALHHQGRTVDVDGGKEIRNQGRQMTRVVAELGQAGLR